MTRKTVTKQDVLEVLGAYRQQLLKDDEYFDVVTWMRRMIMEFDPELNYDGDAIIELSMQAWTDMEVK